MKTGFIGFGNMASAMAGGMIKSGRYRASDIMVSARNIDKLKSRAEKHGYIVSSNKEIAEKADVIFLTVKPFFYKDVIEEIKNQIDLNQIIVTVTPGISISDIQDIMGKKVKVIRTMPNTPAMVGEGITPFVPSLEITDEDKDRVKSILESFGICEEITESQMNAVVPLTGSSPAYVFMFIEAMADEAVLEGIERSKAYRMAAQAVLGSAKMLLETELHPGILKDMVCSPRGTTIEAVRSLEKTGFRSSIIEAMKSCSDKIGK